MQSKVAPKSITDSMLEVLVFSLCVGSFSCDKAMKAYYYQKPHFKQIKKQMENKIERYTGEFIMYSVPALAAAYAGTPFQIKITRHFSCGSGKNDVTCLYRYDF